METKKNVILSLTVLLLLMGILAAGKFLFLSEKEVTAQAPATRFGKYQVSCTSDPSGKGSVTCVVLDTTNGMVTNIIKPRPANGCSLNGAKNMKTCNESFTKNPKKSSAAGKAPAKGTAKKSGE